MADRMTEERKLLEALAELRERVRPLIRELERDVGEHVRFCDECYGHGGRDAELRPESCPEAKALEERLERGRRAGFDYL